MCVCVFQIYQHHYKINKIKIIGWNDVFKNSLIISGGIFRMRIKLLRSPVTLRLAAVLVICALPLIAARETPQCCSCTPPPCQSNTGTICFDYSVDPSCYASLHCVSYSGFNVQMSYTQPNGDGVFEFHTANANTQDCWNVPGNTNITFTFSPITSCTTNTGAQVQLHTGGIGTILAPTPGTQTFSVPCGGKNVYDIKFICQG